MIRQSDVMQWRGRTRSSHSLDAAVGGLFDWTKRGSPILSQWTVTEWRIVRTFVFYKPSR